MYLPYSMGFSEISKNIRILHTLHEQISNSFEQKNESYESQILFVSYIIKYFVKEFLS